MNRTAVAVIIILLVTAFCTCEYLYVAKTVDEYIARIDEIEETYKSGDFEKATKLANNADIDWESRLEYVDMLLYHDYVNEVGVNFASIAKYVEYKEDAEVFANCEMNRRELQSLIENEKPSLANII
ncbi:MAG: DUF4363 family protein [Eubacteriales bacterium]|nr:DUF4363 family protein [Eubacteriales bacterium]